MSGKLINCYFTPVQLALDNVLNSFIAEGNDTYKDGIWRLSSRLGSNNQKLFAYSTSGITLNSGKFVMVSSEDVEVTENNRLNPLCDFKNGLFNSDKLTAWGDNRVVADTSDYKHMRKTITTQENTEASDYTNPITYIADAGRCIGTMKNVFSTVDCKDNLTSGICCYQEYNLENTQCYGFHSNIEGLTGEFEVILSNDSMHCQAKKNIRTGKLTYIEETDPLYNIVPSRFSQAVVIGDYIYYLGADKYVHKVNKNTLVEEKKGTTSYDSSANSLFTDGTKLYMNYIKSNNYNSVYTEIYTTSLGEGSNSAYHTTIPEFIKGDSSYPSKYCQIASIDNGTKFVLFNTNKKCAVVFTDLTNIAGSIINEYTQVNVGKTTNEPISFTLTSKGIYTFWTGSTGSDIGTVSEYSLKVCKNTNGQIFSIAEWETAHINDGSVQVDITLCE